MSICYCSGIPKPLLIPISTCLQQAGHTVYGLRLAFRLIEREDRAIRLPSIQRIKDIVQGKVTFSYKNYRKGGKKEGMQLDQWEFLRRFAMHIVPHCFIRIRHYGILSNRSKTKALLAARAALGVKKPNKKDQEKPTFDPLLPPHYCSCCKRTTPHVLLDILPPIRAGPSTDVLLKS